MEERILEVVKSNASPAVLCQRLQDYHENDIADILEKLSPAERCKLYRILDMDTISDMAAFIPVGSPMIACLM